MTVTLERPATTRPEGNGGGPARRAVTRWAWRMFKREWRQQALVLILLVVAMAATIVGLGLASNTAHLKADPTFGTANTILSLPGSDPNLASDIGVVQSRFGVTDVMAHQTISVPGSVATIDLRAQNPHGAYGAVTLRLNSGTYPTRSGEVAVTSGVANTFGLHLGSTWSEGGRSLLVVGTVENPLDLLDQFALVAPGQLDAPEQVTILVNAKPKDLPSFNLGGLGGLNVSSRGSGNQTGSEALILVLGSLALLFVSLMGVAGFTVTAHRRLRALGMLGALGATDRHVRLVMLANGAAVGGTAALAGALVGLAAWMALVPTLQSAVEHRIDR
ncbi:MAG: hypothetical protein JO337_03730, partial [Acidimicrobiales bacterium]|nr:hypothetical protein [Acidimicrobiales bacterium]